MNERPTLITTGLSIYEEIEGVIIKRAMAEFGSINQSDTVRRIIREWDKLTHNNAGGLQHGNTNRDSQDTTA